MVLEVPARNSIATSQSDIKPVILEVNSDGRVSINGELPIIQSELTENLVIKEAITNELPVHVSAGTEVTLSTLTQLMDQLSASGLTAVSLRGMR